MDAVLTEALVASHSNMEWLWGGLPPAERVVASALAEAGPDPITQDELERLLHESGVRVVIRKLQNAPQLLQEWDLIEPADGGYRFRVELLRRWITENKPLKRVQEELDRIEPVAESFYQAALGLYWGGQLDQAIAPLRQAIGLNPNHVGANQLLADILLARGQSGEARQLLERLYEYQPTAARSRLVQALLAQAQAARSDDTRLAFYKRVLELDPTQPEATTKVAEIEQEMRRRELAARLQELEALEQERQYQDALDLAQDLADEYPEIRDWTSDLERLERKTHLAELYQRGLGALQDGDRKKAQKFLAEVIAMEPEYEEATRYLHLAVTGVDVAPLHAQLEAEEKARQGAARKEAEARHQREQGLKQPTSQRRLSPWNPLDYLRLLWWVLVTPQRLKAYREIFGEKDERRVGKWLASTLIWLPLFILTLALGLETLPRTEDAPPSTVYLWINLGLALAWVLTVLCH